MLKKFINVLKSSPKYSETCLLCGEKVTGSRQKYCSDICGNKHVYYIRHRIPQERWKIPSKEAKEKFNSDMKIRRRNYLLKKNLDFCELCREVKAKQRHHEGDKIICVCMKCHGIIHKYKNLIK